MKNESLRMTERQIKDMVIRRMKYAHFPPEFIYAFEKTGMLVHEGNLDKLPPEDVKEWKDAVAEYRARHTT